VGNNMPETMKTAYKIQKILHGTNLAKEQVRRTYFTSEDKVWSPSNLKLIQLQEPFSGRMAKTLVEI
jgi:hypothetical protein